jgi:uncharacterized membrane protein
MNPFKTIHQNLLALLIFNVLLVFARMCISHTNFCAFLIWNLFLAYIPLAISIYIYKTRLRLNAKTISLFIIWILFLPNAPYLITDILHFKESNTAPAWFDVALLFSSALCGLLMGIISMYIINKKLKIILSPKQMQLIQIPICLAVGFGVYVGRFLRWNSWSILHSPFTVAKECTMHIFSPFIYPGTWGVTIVIGATCWLLLQIINSIAGLEQ